MNRLYLLLLPLVPLTAVLASDDKKDLPPLKLSDDEKTLLDLTNAERAREKLPPLAPNARLFQAARAHAANMAKKGEMKHDLDGKTPDQRLDDAGYDWRKFGENLAQSDGGGLAEIVKGWMGSKGHREHILDPAFTEIGVGIARNDKGDVYYTEDFAAPAEKP
jgi:uncharacterized protein YkwD